MAAKRKAPAKATRTKRAPKKRSVADWAPRFLDLVRQSGNIGTAAQAARVGRTTVYQRRDSDPDFAQALALALEDACDTLELEARRRAMGGVERAVYYKGDRIGSICEYSDVLLIFLLKAHRPEKFRERHEHEHRGGLTLQVVEEIVDAGPDPNDPAASSAGSVPTE